MSKDNIVRLSSQETPSIHAHLFSMISEGSLLAHLFSAFHDRNSSSFCIELMQKSDLQGGPMSERIKDFHEFRNKMNERILERGNLEIKRFFALDKNAYKTGALTAETKELLGLVASLVLRCNDCITYHLVRCVELGISDEQIYEAYNIGLVVGGSIVIPHLRQAVARMDEIRSQNQD